MGNSSSSLAVTNGNILLASEWLEERDVLLRGGRVVELGHGLQGEMTLHAAGAHVLPGLIDLHTHGMGYLSSVAASSLDYAGSRRSMALQRSFLRSSDRRGRPPGTWSGTDAFRTSFAACLRSVDSGSSRHT